MKQKNIFLLGMLSIMLLSSCAGVKVTSDYDKSVDFSKFETYEYYGWAKESNKILNEIEQKRIEKAFGLEFKNRNMKYVESGGDLIITLYIVTEQKTQTTATSVGGSYGGYGGYGYGGYYGHGPGYGWGGSMGYSSTTYNDYNYIVGTLVIDVYDAKEERLIWESIGKKTIDDNPKSRDQNVTVAVAAIMKPYPVAPVKKK